MYLYRVEHKTDRVGPYATFGDMQDERPHLYRTVDHPSPFDEDLDFEYGMHCGFESKKKLLEWFSWEDLEHFEKYGLYVYKIHTDESWFQKGEKQVIFDPALNYYRKRITLNSLRQYAVSFGYLSNHVGEDNGGRSTSDWTVGVPSRL